jgi:YHS domain-containing protein
MPLGIHAAELQLNIDQVEQSINLAVEIGATCRQRLGERLRILSVWFDSAAFNRYRGNSWMPEPCRSGNVSAVELPEWTACARQKGVTSTFAMTANRSTRTLAAIALAVCVLLPGAESAGAAAPAAGAAQPEFGGQCAMGLSEGHSIATDCTITWTAKDGKRYCFSSEDAKKQFLEDPQGNIERALDFSAAGAVQATGERMDAYKTEEVETFVSREIAETVAHNGGIFPLVDPVSGTTLKLVYEKIDFTRTLHGYGFFPDVIFHAQDDAQKRYLIDFWVKPGADKLQIVDTRIRKAPKREGTAWTLQTRQPIPWWWIPASEHPGKTEQTRGWEVMSAVEQSVVERRDPKQGTMKVKDPVTGETLELDFVGTHQPVRRLQQDGRFFACTDFRKAGTTDQFYDLDFWVNEHGGKLTVDEIRLHKVPVKQEDGTWVQKSRYNFDDLKFDVVP